MMCIRRMHGSSPFCNHTRGLFESRLIQFHEAKAIWVLPPYPRSWAVVRPPLEPDEHPDSTRVGGVEEPRGCRKMEIFSWLEMLE